MSEKYKEKFKQFLNEGEINESPLYVDNPHPYSKFNEIVFMSDRKFNQHVKKAADIIIKYTDLRDDSRDFITEVLEKYALSLLDEAKSGVYNSGIFKYVNKDAEIPDQDISE